MNRGSVTAYEGEAGAGARGEVGGPWTGQEARTRGLGSLHLLPGDPGQVTEPRLLLLYRRTGRWLSRRAGSELTCVQEAEQHVSGCHCNHSWWYWLEVGVEGEQGALTSGWTTGRAPRAWPWEGVSENVLTEGSVMPRGRAGGAQGEGSADGSSAGAECEVPVGGVTKRQ